MRKIRKKKLERHNKNITVRFLNGQISFETDNGEFKN